MDIDLLNVDPVVEEGKHKLKRLVQRPDSYFMDVKAPSGEILTIFSHSQIPIVDKTGFVVAVPTGGKVKLSNGTAWRRKGE